MNCDELTIDNGLLIFRDTVAGSEVEVSCLEQHVLVGEQTVVCQSSGEWANVPTCQLYG